MPADASCIPNLPHAASWAGSRTQEKKMDYQIQRIRILDFQNNFHGVTKILENIEACQQDFAKSGNLIEMF